MSVRHLHEGILIYLCICEPAKSSRSRLRGKAQGLDNAKGSGLSYQGSTTLADLVVLGKMTTLDLTRPKGFRVVVKV